LSAISMMYQQNKYTRSTWSGNGFQSHCSTNLSLWAHIHTVSGHQTLYCRNTGTSPRMNLTICLHLVLKIKKQWHYTISLHKFSLTLQWQV